MRSIFFHFLICISVIWKPFIVHAQSDSYINGYRMSLRGETISYDSPDPRAKSALLVRSQDSTRLIQWETAELPSDFDLPMASFVWLFGMDASPDQHQFTLSVNNRDVLKFKNPVKAEEKEVHYTGLRGTELRLRTTFIDRNNDPMGYAVLTLPAGMLSPGKPVKLAVKGETAGSPIWFMTFQYPVENRIDASSRNLLIEREGRRLQAILVEWVNLGSDQEITLQSGEESTEKHQAGPGYNAWYYFIPEVKKPEKKSVTIQIGNGSSQKVSCSVKPVKPWTIYLVQHTHTDIGYTRPQSEILPEHLRFIDYALDYCDQTDLYAEDARFRWTCESAWAVDQYISRRPESQVERLLTRIREGRIEVTAMPFNMSEIADETALRNMLTPVGRFHQKGIEVSTAMQDDVNGIGWCLADYFPDMGVKYLIMGEHGHRARIPFKLPTAFWWASPSGEKVLAYRGEHYMYGNFLLLHTGDLDNFRSNLLKYLDDLEGKGYPFDRISLQYSGYVTDNSPPAITPNQVIQAWNEQYIWPKLRSATASEFMRYIDKNHGTELEVIQKAWPDWWTDGFGSAARETAAVRQTQSEMNISTGLLSMAMILGNDLENKVQDRIEDIYDHILFYDEHTFGAAESISNPYGENSMEQWAEKSSYAWEALKKSRMLREEAFGLLQSFVPRHTVPSISVFNTLNWTRSGPVKVYIDHEILHPGDIFTLETSDGIAIPVQPSITRSDGTYWILWSEDIPPLGYQSYRIVKGKGQAAVPGKSAFSGTYENEFWSVSVDPANGSLKSLIFKEQDRDLVDQASTWKPGQLIYERLSDRHQLELFRLEEQPARTTLRDISFDAVEEGPVFTTLTVRGTLDGCARGKVEVTYHLYHAKPLLEISYRMIKEPVTEPEALYVAFPFLMNQGEILFDVQGGTVKPGKDQLPGTASDWNTVQNFVSVRTEKDQLLVSSPDIPLFHLGGLNLGEFSEDHRLESNHFFSWVLNNYWTTNFRAYQEGEISWHYLITLSGNPDISEAIHFGWDSGTPLVGRVLTKGGSTDQPDRLGLFSNSSLPLLLVNAIPNRIGDGIVLQLREISGQTYRLDPANLITLKRYIKAQEVNALGEVINNKTPEIIFEPWSVHFLEIQWDKK